jgi:CubicO group peptidase (beta-lactamase class C family)
VAAAAGPATRPHPSCSGRERGAPYITCMTEKPWRPSRRRLLVLATAALASPAVARTSPALAEVRHAGLDPERLRERAATLPRLHTLIVMQQGETVLEATFRGPPADRPVNIKSVAKTVIATLVGCAVDRAVLEGPDQPITSVLGPLVPASASPRLAEVTIGHLLSMQAGLERTSGANYGSWVTSRNWVQNALDRPFVADPGGPMLYSTGNSHLLSAILTRATGETTHALANAWLGQPLNIRIPPWDRDPQGIFLGGNNMLLSPRALARFGEMIRNGGSLDGREVVSPDWIATSWQPRTASRWSGHRYGYGWFMTRTAGHPHYYGWGYGGQMLHVVPTLELTIAVTSDPNVRSREQGHMAALRALVADTVARAAA